MRQLKKWVTISLMAFLSLSFNAISIHADNDSAIEGGRYGKKYGRIFSPFEWKKPRAYRTDDCNGPLPGVEQFNCRISTVRHKAGPNRNMDLYFDQNPDRKLNTAFKYSVDVVRKLKAGGYRVDGTIKHRMINDSKVSLVEARRPQADEWDMFAIYRTRSIGGIWHCRTHGDYAQMKEECMQTIYSMHVNEAY